MDYWSTDHLRMNREHNLVDPLHFRDIQPGNHIERIDWQMLDSQRKLLMDDIHRCLFCTNRRSCSLYYYPRNQVDRHHRIVILYYLYIGLSGMYCNHHCLLNTHRYQSIDNHFRYIPRDNHHSNMFQGR